GDVAAGAAMGPSRPSQLAQGIMRGYGPEGARNLSTYVEPATGNEILTGSVGGESIYKNLGKTGAGMQPKPAALQTAVKQAVAPAAEKSVPLPRPRPPEANGYQPET